MANIKFKGVHKSFGSNKIITNFNLEGKEDEEYFNRKSKKSFIR